MKKKELAIKLRACSDVIFYNLIACFITTARKSSMNIHQYVQNIYDAIHCIPEPYNDGSTIDASFIYFHLSEPYVGRIEAIVRAQCYDVCGQKYVPGIFPPLEAISWGVSCYLNWLSKQLVNTGVASKFDMFDYIFDIMRRMEKKYGTEGEQWLSTSKVEPKIS